MVTLQGWSDRQGDRQQWYESDDKLFPAHHQPAILIDMLRSRDICSHKILRGTGVFYEDILGGQSLLSEAQGLTLATNASKLNDEPEMAFRWGASWWPGHYGAASGLLSHACSLRDALQSLQDFRSTLCPWAIPHVVIDDRHCYIYWLNLSGSGAERFLTEAAMSAMTSYSRWMSGERLPWKYGFSYSRPAHDEQYQVNLGSDLWFGLGVDVMFIDRHWLDCSWSRGSATAWQVSRAECHASITMPSVSLPEYVYRTLLQNIRQPFALPDMADHLGMSSATLKRKLGKHGCRFQQLQDQARLQMSLYLLHVYGWNNEQVADHLCFNDTTNFRRAFKRWVGVTPSDSRSHTNLFSGSELAG